MLHLPSFVFPSSYVVLCLRRGVWTVRIDSFCVVVIFFVDYGSDYHFPWVQRQLCPQDVPSDTGNGCSIQNPSTITDIRYFIPTMQHSFLQWWPYCCDSNPRLSAVLLAVLLLVLFDLLSDSDMDASTYGSAAQKITAMVFEYVARTDLFGSASFSWSSAARLFVLWPLNGDNPPSSQLRRLFAVVGIGDGDLHVGRHCAALTGERHAAVPCASSHLYVRVSLVACPDLHELRPGYLAVMTTLFIRGTKIRRSSLCLRSVISLS